MPIYRFVCNECREKFFIETSMKSYVGMRVYCPKCKSEDVRRTLEPIEVIYKGKGFYINDSKKGDTT